MVIKKTYDYIMYISFYSNLFMIYLVFWFSKKGSFFRASYPTSRQSSLLLSRGFLLGRRFVPLPLLKILSRGIILPLKSLIINSSWRYSSDYLVAKRQVFVLVFLSDGSHFYALFTRMRSQNLMDILPGPFLLLLSLELQTVEI